ncbi:MAG: 4-hydroxy-3-methylbut-2-enyl diphosphate reductase [Lachnospiraceae bacterium]|nr:4-hydroxy-3-methylbut-2-enyl diphosphate reductase [Lachnospiraceae bacterium]
MEVILANSAGFCFGVERAINLVHEQVEKEDGRKIFTFGPIIHNDEVVKDLERQGVFVFDEEDAFEKIRGNILIIRSHGVPKRIYEEAEKHEIEIVDATCPFVKKIHNIVAEKSAEGAEIVIIGDKDHPEVQGIIGWADGPVSVIKNEAEAEAFRPSGERPVCVVSQTTFHYRNFQYLVEILQGKGYDITAINTICNATQARQEEAGSIAQRVDTMIVIGDSKSSNTQKLFRICKEYCTDTYYIQTLKDLDNVDLREAKVVGITAGASTPKIIIQEVLLYVRGKKL